VFRDEAWECQPPAYSRRVSNVPGAYHHSQCRIDDQVSQRSTQHGILVIIISPFQTRNLDDEGLEAVATPTQDVSLDPDSTSHIWPLSLMLTWINAIGKELLF
jgi:hypothetical protein